MKVNIRKNIHFIAVQLKNNNGKYFSFNFLSINIINKNIKIQNFIIIIFCIRLSNF